MLYEKVGKRDDDAEGRICYSDGSFPRGPRFSKDDKTVSFQMIEAAYTFVSFPKKKTLFGVFLLFYFCIFVSEIFFLISGNFSLIIFPIFSFASLSG